MYNHSYQMREKMWKFNVVILSSFCVIVVIGQDTIQQYSLNDDPVDLIQSDPDVMPPRGYDVRSARLALSGDKKKEFDDDVRAASVLQSVPYDDTIDILIPPIGKTDPLCESQFRRLWIGKTIWFNGGICYVLYPWWNMVFTNITYATCPRQRCKNLKWTSWLSYYRWWCVQTNYKTFYIWVYCPGSKFPYKRLPLPLSQCCECRRHRVNFTFPDDFAADVSPAVP